jgi:hypothetical protein
MRCPFNGFNMHRYTKTNNPRYNHKEVLSMYGRQKGQHPHPLLRTRMYLHQAKGERRRVLLIGLQNGEPLPKVNQ